MPKRRNHVALGDGAQNGETMKVWTTTVSNSDWEDHGSSGPTLSRCPTPDEALAIMLSHYELTREEVDDISAWVDGGCVRASARLKPGYGYCEILVPTEPAEAMDPAVFDA